MSVFATSRNLLDDTKRECRDRMSSPICDGVMIFPSFLLIALLCSIMADHKHYCILHYHCQYQRPSGLHVHPTTLFSARIRLLTASTPSSSLLMARNHRFVNNNKAADRVKLQTLTSWIQNNHLQHKTLKLIVDYRKQQNRGHTSIIDRTVV